jgi:uncharacterized protein (DUF58 family)
VSRRGRGPRPRKAAGPVAGSLFALALWALVAHNSGSGWVQALGCLLAGFVVVGLLGPGFAVARIAVSVRSNPPDATSGHPVVVVLHTSRPARLECTNPRSERAAAGAGEVALEVVPDRRGELRELDVVVSSAAPFGLLWWTRRVRVALARPLWVAPTPRSPDPALVVGAASGSAIEQHRPRPGRVGEPRGVRPYEPGDLRHMVHWPATAHRGELMVREAEHPGAAVPQVRVLLPDNGPAGDAVAGRALGTVLMLLQRSSPVMVTTFERDGPHTEPVYGPTDARRRLARAVAPGPTR